MPVRWDLGTSDRFHEALGDDSKSATWTPDVGQSISAEQLITRMFGRDFDPVDKLDLSHDLQLPQDSVDLFGRNETPCGMMDTDNATIDVLSNWVLYLPIIDLRHNDRLHLSSQSL